MDKSISVGKVEKAGSPLRRLFPPIEIDHRSHEGTRLFPAAAYRAAPVLRTVTTTEVAGDPSDGGDGMESSSPNACRIFFGNILFVRTNVQIYRIA